MEMYPCLAAIFIQRGALRCTINTCISFRM